MSTKQPTGFEVRDNRTLPFVMIEKLVEEKYGAILGPYGYAVYSTLISHTNNKNKTAWPSIKRIADTWDISTKQVERELAKLEGCELISKESGKAEGQTNVYTVLDPPEELNPFALALYGKTRKGQAEGGKTVSPTPQTHSPTGYDSQSYPSDSESYPVGLTVAPGKTQSLTNYINRTRLIEQETVTKEEGGQVAIAPATAPSQPTLIDLGTIEKQPSKAKAKKSDPRSEAPAILAFRQILEVYPPKLFWDEIIATVTDIEKFKNCATVWRKRGNKPTNLDGLLDWYKNGIPSYSKPQAANNTFDRESYIASIKQRTGTR